MSFGFMYGISDYNIEPPQPNPNGIPYPHGHAHPHHHHHHPPAPVGPPSMVPPPVTSVGLTTSGASTINTEPAFQQYQDLSVMRQKPPEPENKPEPKPKKNRKRRPAGTVCSRAELKRKRNAGEEYVTRKGKVMHKKVYKQLDCKCRLQCSTKVSHDVRKLIFEQFHALADWNNQTQFIVSSVTVLNVKGRKKKIKQEPDQDPSSPASRRLASRLFYLTSQKIRVCKPVFLSTLGITNKRLDYALRKKAVPMTALATPDQRGKKGPQNKTPVSVEEGIRAHINSLPRPSNQPSKPNKGSQNNSASPASSSGTSDLTITKMYSMYQEQCRAHGISPASMWVYTKIYHSELKSPTVTFRKDPHCKRCEKTRVILNSGENPAKIVQMLLKEFEDKKEQPPKERDHNNMPHNDVNAFIEQAENYAINSLSAGNTNRLMQNQKLIHPNYP